MTRAPMTAAEYRAAQAAAMTEAQLLDGILGTPRNPGVALALGWRGYHTHRSQHSPAGFPDLVLVRRGYLKFAELKRQSSKAMPTPEQQAWLRDLAEVRDLVDGYTSAAGVTGTIGVYVWRPYDLIDGTIARTLT